MSAAKKPTADAETSGKTEIFNDVERAAMKERAAEQKKAARRGKKADPEEALREQLEKIAELPEPDRGLAERVHTLISEAAPELQPKLWYGMPGFAKDGKVLVFFQPAGKFKTRYSTLGFNETATLDDGTMWPTSFAIIELTPADEKKIVELVKRAIG